MGALPSEMVKSLKESNGEALTSEMVKSLRETNGLKDD